MEPRWNRTELVPAWFRIGSARFRCGSVGKFRSKLLSEWIGSVSSVLYHSTTVGCQSGASAKSSPRDPAHRKGIRLWGVP